MNRPRADFREMIFNKLIVSGRMPSGEEMVLRTKIKRNDAKEDYSDKLEKYVLPIRNEDP